MKSIRNLPFFGLTVLTGIVVSVSGFVYLRLTSPPKISAHSLVNSIWVSEQINLDSVPQLNQQDFATIIDLRPDGEAPDQPSSKEMEAMVKRNHMNFFYIPVPHGHIPEQAVMELGKAIASAPGPVLLYCRSGKRAARTWALVEASRQNGMNAEAIELAVKNMGQSADDLDADIRQRIAGREKSLEENS